MQSIPLPPELNSPINMAGLLAEVNSIPLERVEDGSGQARGPGATEGWIHGLSMARIRLDPYSGNHVWLWNAMKALPINWLAAVPIPQDFRQIMVNRLEAQSCLQAHRDGGPKQRELLRYHLPIFTTPGVEWWDEKHGSFHMSQFRWWGPVPYMHTLHAMHNHSDFPRIHVIVDLEP